MSQNTSSFIKILAGAFSACLVVVCGFSVWFISVYGNQPWASLWLGSALLILFCLCGLGTIILMDLFFRRPLAALSEFTANILSGNYPAAILPSTRYNSSLESSVGKLADNYKERLGFSRSILEGLPIPCCIVDTEQRITFLNSECLDMIGSNAAPEIYHGRMISQIFYKDDRKALIGTCMDDDSRAMNREAVFKHVSGSDIHVVANLFPLHDVEGAVIGGCCLYMDTTELKVRQEQVLEQSRCIATAAGEAEGVALELTVAADQLKGLVESARHGAREQARRTGETATAMEEMNASILEVASHAQDASENAHDAKVRAEEGALTVKEVVRAIEEVAGHATALKASMDDLDERSEGIGKVLSVIEDIADQTNLLALNAAIEAARAGEAGRGFAVVADEVRKLAEKTMQATTEVHAAVSGIQEGARTNARATETAVVAIHKSTDMAGRSGEVLAQIVAVSETTAERVRAIASAAGQQSAASDQINQATVEVNRISSDTDEAMTESSDAITRLASLAQRLSGVIGGMRSQDF